MVQKMVPTFSKVQRNVSIFPQIGEECGRPASADSNSAYLQPNAYLQPKRSDSSPHTLHARRADLKTSIRLYGRQTAPGTEKCLGAGIYKENELSILRHCCTGVQSVNQVVTVEIDVNQPSITKW